MVLAHEARRRTSPARLTSILFVIAASVAAVGVADAAGNLDAESLKRELLAPWIVTIHGESRARALLVRGADQKSDSAWTLDAAYDWLYAEKPPSVKAELTVTSGGYRLELTTRANSLIVAESADLKAFTGTFKPTSGESKQATIEKVSPEEFSRRQKAAFAQLFVQPGPGVPTSCAGFVGRWVGDWPFYGKTWLWVVEVKSDCVARCTNRSNPAVPDSFQSCQIKDGVLARSKPEGMEYYELRGDELWARFVPTGGMSNNTVFRRVQPGSQ